MTRSRWLLAVLMIGVLAGTPLAVVTPGAAQSAPAGTELVAGSGSPGTFQIGHAVGVCRHTQTGGAWQAAVEVTAPTARGLTGVANQRIEWEPRAYQRHPLTLQPQLLNAGALQSNAVSAGGSVSFSKETFSGLPEGPAYIAGGRLTWYAGDTFRGAIEFVYVTHHSLIGPSGRLVSSPGACTPAVSPELTLSTYRTTVNVAVHLTGRYFPLSTPVAITWNGKTLDTVMSDAQGNVSGSIRVPATPLGDYRLGFDGGIWWQPAATLTVAPRIKVIPDAAARGDTVKISLRGFAKKESVRIRWRDGDGRWIELGWVTTSNTGSGELWIPVPNWVPDGPSSVRGDGPIARAQTNAVTINGGPLITLADEDPAPTPTPELDASPVPDPAEPVPPPDDPATVEAGPPDAEESPEEPTAEPVDPDEPPVDAPPDGDSSADESPSD